MDRTSTVRRRFSVVVASRLSSGVLLYVDLPSSGNSQTDKEGKGTYAFGISGRA
jgi:hypothetical protein